MEVARCDRCGVGQVARVQDQCVPGTNVGGDLAHRLVVNDVGGEGQADGVRADGLDRLFGLEERGFGATDQDEALGTGEGECYGSFAADTAALVASWFVSLA